jgi:hypothetical protein
MRRLARRRKLAIAFSPEATRVEVETAATKPTAVEHLTDAVVYDDQFSKR